jgi:hypothetical protein
MMQALHMQRKFAQSAKAAEFNLHWNLFGQSYACQIQVNELTNFDYVCLLITRLGNSNDISVNMQIDDTGTVILFVNMHPRFQGESLMTIYA